MEYTALYRRFRPQKFSEIYGQEHIVRTLQNQIMSGRVGHAYLFTGCRGCGKTTSAKILARAINCLNPINGEPCNECSVCKAALNETLTDIVEMDAASNNGVDDVRAIRDEVNFLPTVAKYRVYIIDEVHMLSTGAFNALNLYWLQQNLINYLLLFYRDAKGLILKQLKKKKLLII